MDIVILHVHRPFAIIRYCLRAIEKHTQYDRIFIVGDLPKFLKPSDSLIHIPHKRKNFLNNKGYDIWDKVKTACQDERLSDDFVLFSDDCILMQDVNEFKTYKRGHKLNFTKNESGEWERIKPDTLSIIERTKLLCYNYWNKKLGFKPFNYDLHCPIPLNKDRVLGLSKNALYKLKEVRAEGAYLIKSSYGNYFNIDAEVLQDVKLSIESELSAFLESFKGWYFSSGLFINQDGETKKVFESLFPKVSKFEVEVKDNGRRNTTSKRKRKQSDNT